MRIIGVGQIVLWPGGNLWIGRSTAPVEPHAHHAIQVSIALGGTLRLRPASDPGWTVHEATLVPAHLPHAFEAVGSEVATLFCEPESALGRRLSAAFPVAAISTLAPTTAAHLRETIRGDGFEAATDADLVARSVAALEHLAGGETAPRGTDPRILRAIALMEARLDEPLALEDLADAVGLSPSRFRHLFVAETGLPFRRHLLWLRLQRALATALAGQTWTEAAHAANFADQAHLTRTFRQMFGTAPTALGHPTPLVDALGR